MRAVVVREFGPPDVLVVEELADPRPGPGEALIAVEAASVVFIETQIRAGKGQVPAHRPELPVIPGNGVGGVVVDVGDAVDRSLVGSRVVSTTGGTGGYAELVAVDVTEVVTIPDGVSVMTATALLADGRTAVGLSHVAQPSKDEWVLVEAAGGGVGHLLVQLARAAGAKVVGAASSPAKLRVAAEAGAEVTVDYTKPGWVDRVRDATGGVGVDLVYDGVGGDVGLTAFGLLRDGGRFVVHGMASGQMTELPDDAVARRNVTVLGLGSMPSVPLRELTATALAEAAAGRLRPTIGQTFPLEQAAAAHAAIERRATVGKTLLLPRRS
ncbi:MAG TPA: zinc-binding dehydrogenase [Actinopolymorphaceae bacterium]